MGSNPTHGSFFFENRELFWVYIYLPCFDFLGDMYPVVVPLKFACTCTGTGGGGGWWSGEW